MARYWVNDNLGSRTSLQTTYSNVHILLQEELSPVIWPGQAQAGWAAACPSPAEGKMNDWGEFKTTQGFTVSRER